MSGHDLREWTVGQVRSAMTYAMRADPDALDRLAGANSAVLDSHSAAFLRSARMLTLGTSAALFTVLTVHRSERDRHERPVCAACGTGRCRTVRAISDALAAYGLQSRLVDRAEAWRRADAWYTRAAARPVLLSIEPFDEGFIARPTPHPDTPDGMLVVDRHTGALTQWPSLDTDHLAAEYHTYKHGNR
ncbi:hypothetical protein [Actinomadura sp. WMMA1423]|uniref:hypothetical protein n=1 Tax=Actinomadura sp. WMMA1423 TaxID=2591108 RepID=UPI00114666BC|nr:hypothetical protein [Actinomadura sp. WMMA1423]